MSSIKPESDIWDVWEETPPANLKVSYDTSIRIWRNSFEGEYAQERAEVCATNLSLKERIKTMVLRREPTRSCLPYHNIPRRILKDT